MVRVVEAIAVVLLSAVTAAEVVPAAHGFLERLVAVVLSAGIALPLLLRRQWPLATTATMIAAGALTAMVFGYGAAGGGPWVCLVVATYGVGAYATSRRSAVGLAMIMIVAAAASLPKVLDGEPVTDQLTPVGILVVVWAAGRIGARRGARAADVERRASELATRGEEIAREAAERERARIARELHDAVTHDMTVMVIQAQAAQSLSTSDPDRAREAMRAVEESGRSALVEMRRLLGVIRGDATADREPQPAMKDIETLVTRVRDAGLPATYSIEGDPTGVPAGLAVCCYRIVQEALSNVVRHSGAVPTEVSVDISPASIRLDISNGPGRSPVDDTPGAGRGLAGMRERVAVFRGSLQAGPREDRGFVVNAVLPLVAE
jgi:signal transduction histidine kinase